MVCELDLNKFVIRKDDVTELLDYLDCLAYLRTKKLIFRSIFICNIRSINLERDTLKKFIM